MYYRVKKSTFEFFVVHTYRGVFVHGGGWGGGHVISIFTCTGTHNPNLPQVTVVHG